MQIQTYKHDSDTFVNKKSEYNSSEKVIGLMIIIP